MVLTLSLLNWFLIILYNTISKAPKEEIMFRLDLPQVISSMIIGFNMLDIKYRCPFQFNTFPELAKQTLTLMRSWKGLFSMAILEWKGTGKIDDEMRTVPCYRAAKHISMNFWSMFLCHKYPPKSLNIFRMKGLEHLL